MTSWHQDYVISTSSINTDVNQNSLLNLNPIRHQYLKFKFPNDSLMKIQVWIIAWNWGRNSKSEEGFESWITAETLQQIRFVLKSKFRIPSIFAVEGFSLLSNFKTSPVASGLAIECDCTGIWAPCRCLYKPLAVAELSLNSSDRESLHHCEERRHSVAADLSSIFLGQRYTFTFQL